MNTSNNLPQSGTLADLIRSSLCESDESALAYLMQGWLSNAMGALRNARRQAGLTQEDVAQRLGTTQSAVARLEKDYAGRCSLQRYIEYLAACGALPLTIETVPQAKLRDYTLANPDAPRTATAYQAWHATITPVKMFSMPHRQGTADTEFDMLEGGDQAETTSKKKRRQSLGVLQGGLAETFESIADMEALAV